MRLFDCIARNRTTPKRDSEPVFLFYNNSARDGMDDLRNMLEMWFARYPDDAKLALRSRFRSDADIEHQGAFFELFTHELFSGLGFSLEIHPSLDSGERHPDFRATRGAFDLVIESTVAAPSTNQEGASRRAATVLDEVSAMCSPDFFLDVEIDGSPRTQPSSRALMCNLARWLESLSHSEMLSLYQEQGYEALPVLNWEHDGWKLAFRPIPKKVNTRGVVGYRTIMSRLSGLQAYDARNSIANSLHKKASRYGDLSRPYVICVNALDEMADETDVIDAIFGRAGIGVTLGADPKHKPIRFPNGSWFGPRGLKNSSNSGVLFTLRLNPWNVGRNRPALVHHPRARYPLPFDELPFRQFVPDDVEPKLRVVDGGAVAPYLWLPDGWTKL